MMIVQLETLQLTVSRIIYCKFNYYHYFCYFKVKLLFYFILFFYYFVYLPFVNGSNSSLFRNATSSEDLHNRLAGLKMEVTSRTSEISTQNQSLVVKTTTVISQTSTNGTTNGEIETNQINESQQINSEYLNIFIL